MDEKILLVDDEEGIRTVLGISLRDVGYEVHTAENGFRALEIFREHHPEIVLTDIKMPGMDGIELLETIKTERPQTEVIMITGHGDLDLAIKSIKLDAADFVTKPINQDVLDIALGRARERLDHRHQIKRYTENLEQTVREKSARLIELERRLAVGQVVEGMSDAMRSITEAFEGGADYFNEMPCFVSIHDEDLKVVSTNRLYRQKFGDMVGRSSCEIYLDEGGGMASCPVRKTFESGRGQRLKASFRSRQGGDVPVIVTTAPIKNGARGVELVLEIAADMSEVKKLQEELRSTQQRYQELFDIAPCFITVQDRELRIVDSNRRFKSNFGADTGSFCYKVYKHRDTPCPECPVLRTFKDGQPHQEETVVTSLAGDKINVLVWTAPVRDASGEVIQVMELSTNITQIRQLQDHLTSLGLMLGSMSHGVKGMLTSLDGGLYRLESGLKKQDRAKVEDAYDVVRQMTGRIKSMVLDILYYAKSRELSTQTLEVSELCSDIVAVVRPRAEQAGVTFNTSFSSNSLGSVEADLNALSPALVNLLENAVDACQGDVKKVEHRVDFAVSGDEAQLLFEITDNGLGMDRETQEKIFTLFFSSKGRKGTGLGLFIANHVVEQHGGSITVESTPGSGSRFMIRLPRSIPQSRRPAEAERCG